MKQYNRNILRANLRNFREWYGYSQEQISRCLRIKRPMYAKYEEKKRNEPNLTILVRLSNFYRIGINDMATKKVAAKEFYKVNRRLLK